MLVLCLHSGRREVIFRVRVTENRMALYIQGNRDPIVSTSRPHFQFQPRVGVVVASGYNNVIAYRLARVQVGRTRRNRG